MKSIFPRVETLPSFFPSLSSLHPFIGVKWLPRGKLSSTTICMRLARGSPAKEGLLLNLLHPSIPNSPLMPSHHLPPTLSTPVPAKGYGRAPSPSQRNFPVEIYISFRSLKFYSQCVKRLKLLSPFNIHLAFLPLLCLLFFKCFFSF